MFATGAITGQFKTTILLKQESFKLEMNCFSGYISSLPGVQCDRWVENVNLTCYLIFLKTRFHLTKCGSSAIQGDQFFLSHIPPEDDVMIFFKKKYKV